MVLHVKNLRDWQSSRISQKSYILRKVFQGEENSAIRIAFGTSGPGVFFEFQYLWTLQIGSPKIPKAVRVSLFA